MSLIHWWPLNGDTKDHGIRNISLTNNGATINNSGKIGKCYSFSYNNMVVATSDITSATELSLCLWLKISATHSSWSQVLVLGTSGTSWNNIRCGIDINGDGKIYFNVSNGSANTYIASPLTYKDAAWHHIVGVYNNGSLKLYIDGTQVVNGTTTNVPGLSGTSIYVGGNAGGEKANNGDCLNDARVYDHALSQKEVKEISKGLVLHYNFEDAYAEGTTNLVTSINAGGQTTVSNGVVTTSGTSADTYFQLNLSESLISGTVYTISCDAEIPEGSWSFPIGGQSNTSLVFQIFNGHNEYTFTMNSFNAGTNRCFMDDINRNAAANHQCKMYNWQIEKKGHATPYVNGTRQPGLIYDSSGYGYNATPVNNPQILEDSGCGMHCVNLTNATNGYFDLGTATFNFVTNGTVCFWAKYVDSNYKMILGANDSGSKYLGANTPNGSSSSGNWYSNVTQGTCYCDGEVYTKPKIDSQWHLYCFSGVNFSSWGDLKYFLCIYANNPSNSFQFHGYLADFKIYSTVLSASDILAEYNRKASIDRDGNLYTGEFVEENDRINIAKTDVIEASVFEEGTSLVKKTDKYVELEYIQSDGNQWMDSNVSITANLNVYCKIQWTNISGSYPMLYGAWSIFSLSSMPSSKLCIASGGYSGNNPWSAGPSISANVIYHIKHHPNKLTINNVLYTIPNAGATNNANARHVLLFAASNTGDTPYNWSTYCKAKMYRFEIYDGSEQVRNFIPAKRKSDNVVGLYDTVNRQFYTNSGSGSFTAGPEKGNLSIVYSKQIIEN